MHCGCPRPSGGPSAVQLGRPTRTTNVSGEFLYWLADCPLTLSGLSAIHLRQSTRDNDVSGRISNPNGGPSGPPWQTFRSSLCPTTRDDNVSGQNPRLYGGLSVPPWRTVRSSPLRTPPDNFVSGQTSIPTADCPLSNSGPSAVQFAKPPETTSSLDNF